jgi:hypothetical protein
MNPITTHPLNPHYLFYRGSAIIPITSDQRFMAVINSDFDYVRFLDKLKSKGMNFTRIYPGASFRFGDVGNAPKKGRQLLPWKLTKETGASADLGGFKYDLDAWNEAYFKRLVDFCEQARERGIIVLLTFYNAMYAPDWEHMAMFRGNNIQGAGKCGWDMVQSLDGDTLLLKYQEKYVREIVRRLNGLDNMIYYMCSEPQMSSKPASVFVPWLDRMIAVFRDAEKDLPHKHMLGQSVDKEFWKGPGVSDFSADPRISFVTMRCRYSLFLLKDKYPLNKPLVHHGSVMYSDADIPGDFKLTGDKLGSTRLEAWEYLLSGAASFMQYNALFTVENPAGSGTVDKVFDVLAGVKKFMESIDYISMKKDDSFITGGVPEGAHVSAISETGKQYALYVHHGKETYRYYTVEPGKHQETLTFNIPKGEYAAEWINPNDASVLRSEKINHAGGALELTTPEYSVDMALKIDISKVRH